MLLPTGDLQAQIAQSSQIHAQVRGATELEALVTSTAELQAQVTASPGIDGHAQAQNEVRAQVSSSADVVVDVSAGVGVASKAVSLLGNPFVWVDADEEEVLADKGGQNGLLNFGSEADFAFNSNPWSYRVGLGPEGGNTLESADNRMMDTPDFDVALPQPGMVAVVFRPVDNSGLNFLFDKETSADRWSIRMDTAANTVQVHAGLTRIFSVASGLNAGNWYWLMAELLAGSAYVELSTGDSGTLANPGANACGGVRLSRSTLGARGQYKFVAAWSNGPTRDQVRALLTSKYQSI